MPFRRTVPVLLALVTSVAIAHAGPSQTTGPQHAALMARLRGLVVALADYSPAMSAQVVRLVGLGFPAVRDGIARTSGAVLVVADRTTSRTWSLEADADGAVATRTVRTRHDGELVESTMQRRITVKRGAGGKVVGATASVSYTPDRAEGRAFVTTAHAHHLPGVRVTSRGTHRRGVEAGRVVARPVRR
jgi:hypothetical protein